MTKHLARCGQCEGCLSPPCMKCKYCDDLYSGKPKKLKQICISRRCSVVMERQKERNLERRQHQLKRTYSVEKPINLDESSEVELSEKKSQLCGTCQVCLQPNCGLCYYCIDQTVYGGKHFSNAHCQRKVCEKLSSSVAVSNLEPESPETDAPSTSGSYCPSGKKPPMSPNKKLANPFYTPMLNGSYKKKRVSFELNGNDSSDMRIRRQKRLARDRIRRVQERAKLDQDELDSEEDEEEAEERSDESSVGSTGPTSLERLFSLALLPRKKPKFIRVEPQLEAGLAVLTEIDRLKRCEDNWDDLKILEGSAQSDSSKQSVKQSSVVFPSTIRSYVGGTNEPCGLLLSFEVGDIEKVCGSTLSVELPSGSVGPRTVPPDSPKVPSAEHQLNCGKLPVESVSTASPVIRLVSLPMVTKPTGVVGTALRPPIDLYRSPGKTITISPSAVRVYSPNMAKLPQGTHVTIHSRHSSPVNGGNHLERVLMVNNLPNGSSQLGKRLIPVSIGGQQNDRLIAVPASTATSADAALNMAKAIVNAGSSQPNSTVLFANRIVVPNQILTSLNAGRPAGTTTVAVSNNNNSTPISTVFCGGDTNTVAPATPQTLLQ